jgi:hypothetical protein
MADERWQQSAVDFADGIRRKRHSGEEVMTSGVARIRALTPSPRYSAAW